MRSLLKQPYIPFGTQYYRAPSPAPEAWEADLANIARLGLNTVKFWVQWRWNNPEEGRYMFDDIDRLMDIAGRNNLRVMLNTIVDVAPVWIYRKYPDVSMVTLDGRKIGPQVQPHRQIGGLGACFNHAPAMEHMFDFLRTTVRRYTDHPALEIWNVASEPELTSSMAEMRLYADDAAKIGDMLCYCQKCRAGFIRWLAEKYGTIERLNGCWNKNYRSFEEIELPRTRNSFNDVIDWRMFFVDTVGRNVERRFEVAKEEDRGKHPLMCHHVFIQGFPVTSTANDPWNVGRFGDLHGITQMDDPMMCDVLRSCARGKPVISAEMLMLFGYTLDLPDLITANDVKRNVFTGIAANLKGFVFWQYRPETLAREAPAWGLTHLDGSSTPWLESFAEVNRVLQRNGDFLLDARPRKADVAILYDPENQVFGWVATGNEKSVTDSLLGVHKALYESNFVVDLIHPREFPGVLGAYRVIYVPFPYYLSETVCSALKAWVEAGGLLIGESYFGGWYVEMGRHQTTVPGYGMQEVFGACQIHAARGDSGGRSQITMTKSLRYIRAGQKVHGAIVREALHPTRAQVLGTFSNGEPAITSATYGRGRAILIGSYLGLPYYRGEGTKNGDLIASLADLTTGPQRPTATPGKVRVDLLTDATGSAMIVLRNLGGVRQQTVISVPGLHQGKAIEQFGGKPLLLRRHSGGVTAKLTLGAGEVKVYRV
jgi:beta-galactosidase